MSEIRSLYLQFAVFQRQAQNQINELKKEVQELREIVAQRNDEPKIVSSDTVQSEKKKTSDAKLDPITYSEAFAMIGGTESLHKQAERSRHLVDAVNNAKLQAELNNLFPLDTNKRTGFSTNLINQKYVPTLDDLYSKAEAVLGDFSETLNNLASKSKNCRAVVGPLKTKVRARMKGAFKYRNPQNNTISWYRLTDLVRGTLEFTNIEDLYDGLETLIQHFGEDVRELNDRYQTPMPGGYRDIQTVVQFKGHMCEIQLNTAQMMQAKATTGHRNYSVHRELKSAVEAGDISRVLSAFEFGREHLGGAVDDKGEHSGLKELLRGDAGTLTHKAAIQGYAEILHAFLIYGADHDMQDKNGDTALHLATFHGHEPCVWVLTHEGLADLDIKNNDGHTALAKGYLMLWQRPPEAAVRAVSTLAQVCGIERIKEAKAIADAAIGSQLHQSRSLVDHAADGNISKMTEELRQWADPMSKDGNGQSALEMAISHGHRQSVELLISYRAVPTTEDMCTAIKLNHEELWEILTEECDHSSLDTDRLVKAAHESGLQFVQGWLQRLSTLEYDLSKYGLQPPFNGIFIMQNVYHGQSGYISFTAVEKRLRAIYSDFDAMPVEFVPTGEPYTYKLRNRWPGENYWISFSEDGTWLYAMYADESEAMPIKFVATSVPNVYKMMNMWGGQENKWISFTNEGTWLRATYAKENDAMPVRLSFRV